jgi:hypothetical protein
MADELGWHSAWAPVPLSRWTAPTRGGFGPAGPVTPPAGPILVSKLSGYAILEPEQAAVSKLSGYGLLWPDKAAASKLSGYALIFEGVRVSKLIGYALQWPAPRINPFDGVVLEAALDKQRSVSQQLGEAAGREIRLLAVDAASSVLLGSRASSVPYGASDGSLRVLPLAALRGGVSRTDSGITFVINNNAPLPIIAGAAGFVVISDYLTVTGWSLSSDVTGSIEIDIWKSSGGIPSIAGSITGSALPSLSGARSGASSTLTGWSVELVPGDILSFYVNSNASCTRVTLNLQAIRT